MNIIWKNFILTQNAEGVHSSVISSAVDGGQRAARPMNACDEPSSTDGGSRKLHGICTQSQVISGCVRESCGVNLCYLQATPSTEEHASTCNAPNVSLALTSRCESFC